MEDRATVRSAGALFLFAQILIACTLSMSWAHASTMQPSNLAKKLQVNITATFGGRTLRYALTTLSNRHNIRLFLDRRVDPDLIIDEFSAGPATVLDILTQLAKKGDADVVVVSDLVYVGPSSKVHMLPHLLASKRRAVAMLEPASKALWAKSQGWSWEKFATPRELIDEWSMKHSIDISGSQKVPHDLWVKTDLPPMSAVTQLTVVLFGLDLHVIVGPDSGSLAQLPNRLVQEKVYSIRVSDSALAQMKSTYPEAVFERAGNKLKVKADVEVHAALAQALTKSPRPRTVKSAERTFTLTVQNKPAGAVMQAIKQQTGMQVIVAPGASEKLESLVTVKVKDVTLGELLSKTLTPAGLRFKVDGQVIKVR